MLDPYEESCRSVVGVAGVGFGGRGGGEDVVLGRGHGGTAHAVVPEEFVEDDVVGGVGVAEIKILAFLPVLGVHFVEQAVVAIAVVGVESGLRSRAVEERRHDGGAGIVCVHGRSAEERFDRADNVDRGVESVVDERRGLRQRRILADDENDAAMGIDVVGSVLGVVFEDENGGIVPIGAVGDGVDDSADGEIVVGNGSGGAGLPLGATGSVVVQEDARE